MPILIVYVISMFMVSIDGTIVNVILPTIAADYGVPENKTNGINIAYLISIAVCLPASGYLANRFGVKKVLLMGITGFTLASFLCGIAPTLGGLIAARVLQGLAGGIIAPVGMTMLFRTFGPEGRKRLSGSLVLPIAFAPAAGPLVGGVLSEYISWHWAFFINLPFGIFVILLGLLTVKEFELFRPSFDLKGYILIAAGLPAIMAAMSLTASGSITVGTAMLGAAGITLVWIFYRHEYRMAEPLLDMRLYEDRLFRSLSFVAMCSMGALMGMLYLFPLMYQTAYSATPLESSLITFTEALGLMAASRLMQKTAKRFGMKAAIQGGLLGTILIFIGIIMLGPSGNPWFLRFLMFCIGVFLGHTVIGSQVTAFNHVSKVNMSKATTLYNMLNRVGAAAGIAVGASILAMTSGHMDILLSYQTALCSTIALLAAGFLCTMSMKTDFAAGGR